MRMHILNMEQLVTHGKNGRKVVNLVRNLTKDKLQALDAAVFEYKLAQSEYEAMKTEHTAREQAFALTKQKHQEALLRMKQDLLKVIQQSQREFVEGLSKKRVAQQLTQHQHLSEEAQRTFQQVTQLKLRQEDEERKFCEEKTRLARLIEEAKATNAQLRAGLLLKAPEDVPETGPIEPCPLEYPEYAGVIPLTEERPVDKGMQRVYESGHSEYVLTTGVRYEVYPNGYRVFFFPNQDVKQVFPDKKVTYYFAASDTTQISLPDGTEIFRFPHGQVEKYYPDGRVAVKYLDGTRSFHHQNSHETVFPDGTRLAKHKGVQQLTHPGGHVFQCSDKGVYQLLKNFH